MRSLQLQALRLTATRDEATRNYLAAVANLKAASTDDPVDNGREYGIEVARLWLRLTRRQLLDAGLTVDDRGEVVPIWRAARAGQGRLHGAS